MIQVGTQILVFTKGWLIVDEVDSETGLLWCIDQDGEEFEISEGQIDSILESNLPDNPFDQFSWRYRVTIHDGPVALRLLHSEVLRRQHQ